MCIAPNMASQSFLPKRYEEQIISDKKKMLACLIFGLDMHLVMTGALQPLCRI